MMGDYDVVLNEMNGKSLVCVLGMLFGVVVD